MGTAGHALVRRIEQFVQAPDDSGFEPLAAEALAFQFQNIEPFRRLCQARGYTPEPWQGWRQVPAVPVAAFKRLRLCADQPAEVFRSSGTLGGEAGRSVHFHPYPDLYRRVIDATFAASCFPATAARRRPILSLIPPRQVVADSSLGFMAEHILARHGDDHSRMAVGESGVMTSVANTWCQQLQAHGSQQQGAAGTILATAFALAQWLDELETAGLRFQLPAGSTIFETGGFKGRSREMSRSELLDRVQRAFGVEPRRVVREYGMTELTGHFYSRVLAGGDPDVFVPPPWMRVRCLDPVTLEPVAPLAPGLVAIFDLTNVGSALHVLSQDIGIMEPGSAGGFRLVGRATGAELRGCSLTVEELANH